MERIALEFEQVTGISRKFRLKDISFSLPAGFICGLMGVNGAGKTTLLRYIMEDKKLYTGTIYVDGLDIWKNHSYIKNRIGFVSEENHFFREQTAMQNVDILSRFYENFDRGRFLQMMEKMELSPKKTYNKMSRGECIKFQLAFAVAHHPTIYLMDEVTAGMDPVFRIDFFKLLQEIIAEEQASVLMTGHIASEMERKTDYVGILERGTLIKFGESMDVIPAM